MPGEVALLFRSSDRGVSLSGQRVAFRSTGVAAIAILEILIGLALFFGFAWQAFVSDTSPSSNNTGGIGSLSTALTLFLAVYGSVLAIAGYNLWRRTPRGRVWSIVLIGIGVILLSISTILYLRPGPPYYYGESIPLTGVILGLLGIWYLSRKSPGWGRS